LGPIARQALAALAASRPIRHSNVSNKKAPEGAVVEAVSESRLFLPPLLCLSLAALNQKPNGLPYKTGPRLAFLHKPVKPLHRRLQKAWCSFSIGAGNLLRHRALRQ